MKSKQVLSVEQMKHLQEIGLELRNTSMLLWYKQMLGKIPISDWELSVWRESLFSEDHVYPAYTLQDILDKLPKRIETEDYEFELYIYYHENGVSVFYDDGDITQLAFFSKPTRCCVGALKTDMLKLERRNNYGIYNTVLYTQEHL